MNELNKLNVNEKQREVISEAMLRSLKTREMIRLKMNDPQEELLIEGVIDFFDSDACLFGVDGEQFNVRCISSLA